jgi:asparagine synthase (glutamine-hydrolysing)
MCGIVGIYNLDGSPASNKILKKMTDIVAHRGPDGEGHFSEGPIGLGHRRLAIIDLSPDGRQPMTTDSSDAVITYNGEIYNFQELRVELQAKGHRFTSRTDTEVVLHAYEEWGERCIDRFNGMFAFAIYDRNRTNSESSTYKQHPGRLILARDRYGIKPLYYYYKNGVFLFASEIKSLLQHPDVQVNVHYPALSEYFTFQNIFSDLTLFEDIRLLSAGSILIVDPTSPRPIHQYKYWDYNFDSTGFDLSPEETVENLLFLFDQAVSRQLIADVPVGSYLSGGMDSGSVTAIASRHIPRMHTFTGGFDLSSASGMEMGFDERAASEVMANLFKTEHYEIVMHAGDMEHVLPELIWHLEDLRVGQCYPNYYVARLASKFIKVVLSGGGGDELFAGYPWRYYRGLNANGSEEYFQSYYDYWQRLIPDEDRQAFFNSSTYKQILDHRPRDIFRNVFFIAEPSLETIEDVVNASLYFEIKTFLHGLFVVEDKLSMAHSLETRVPFMDNDLVDFAMRIPPSYKLNQIKQAPIVNEDDSGKLRRYRMQPTSDGKIVLRETMSRIIPDEITQRAKQGFSAPDASWFRGESIEYVNTLLRDPRAHIYEFFNQNYVSQVLDEHTEGRINHRLMIWSLLSFEWWCRKFLHGE